MTEQHKINIIVLAGVLTIGLLGIGSMKMPEETRVTITDIQDTTDDPMKVLPPEELIDELVSLETLNTEKTTYVSERLGRFVMEARNEPDEIDALFDKFEAPYEYRDYIRNLCMIYNVDTKIYASLVRIESWFGQVAYYNEKHPSRMYGKNKEFTDLGLAQLSTRYEEDWENVYYNPDLIFSLGYSRFTFNIKDPYINLQIGAAYLRFLLNYYDNDYEKAVQAYNCGFYWVDQGKVPNITKAYSNAILNHWKYREKDI